MPHWPLATCRLPLATCATIAMQCSHCGVCIGQVRAASCLRLLMLPVQAFAMTLTWHWLGPASASASALALARQWPILHAGVAASHDTGHSFLLIWLLYAFSPAATSSTILLFFLRLLRLLLCLIIKMTKYLEKIINFVCMFGKIISCRYKVPFMSCLYLLSPSREHCLVWVASWVAMRHSLCLLQRFS